MNGKGKILDYELMVYVCDGTDDERLEWFKTVNIASEKLTAQELLNACYSGSWCQDAKKYFSKPGGPAAQVGDKYLKGSAIRQDYLEAALTWICDRDDIAIPEYMARHQNDPTALELWSYFRAVIDWVESVFGKNYRRKLMQGLPWGLYYNEYGPCVPGRPAFDPDTMEQRIAELEQDEDITNQRGIYEYLLSGETMEQCLHIRAFSDKDKRRKYAEQGGICPRCGNHFEYEKMDGDHILPWKQGGHTEYSNLQMLCIKCNRSNR